MPMVTEMFSSIGNVVRRPGREISQQDLVDQDVLLVRSITQVDAALLQATSVQFVGTATIGTDHIDQEYLAEQSIGFSNAPGCNADAVVEYVLSVIFLLAERYGFDPKTRNFGIVGVGNVGGRLQKRLDKLGYNILLNDPIRAEQEPGFVDLDQLIQECDVICLHTPLTCQGPYPTRHLFSAKQLNALKPNCILLNAGRGPVIDNQALLKVSEKRPDLKLVLDVWEYEPWVDPKLAERCDIISPHIAGYSFDGKIRGTFMLYKALCQHLGIVCQHTLSDFLPSAELSELEQGDHSVLELMQRVYDPQQDDLLLRNTLTLPESEQKAAFDHLRKQYRIRREFASLNVLQAKDPQQLEAIGFQLAEPG